jgi:[acyl-carrier-protein] S-malonyltransferase
MLDGGVNLLIECGPGRVLTGLNRRIERDKRIGMLAIEDAASLQAALEASTALAAAG